jgi:peptidoglycan/LPS O-acetylase OafA/YrhL
MNHELSEQAKNRIQILRGIAITAVVVIHTVTWNPYEIYIRPFVNFSVGLFLFLSGFLTVSMKDGITAFYGKRGKRVFIPYVIWSLLLCLVYQDWNQLPYHLITFQESSIYYYIFVYLQLTLLAPVLLKVADTGLWWSVLLVTPAAILGEYTLAFMHRYLIYPWNVNNCLVWMIFFYLGILLRKKENVKRKNVAKTETLLIFLGVVGILLEFEEEQFWIAYGRADISTTQTKLSSMLVGVCVCLLAYHYINAESAPKRLPILQQCLIKLGDCSFGVYLMHPLVILILGKIWNLSFPLSTVAVLALCFTLVLLGQKLFGRKLGTCLGFY